MVYDLGSIRMEKERGGERERKGEGEDIRRLWEEEGGRKEWGGCLY